MEVTTAMLADAARVEGGKLYIFGGAWDRIYTVNIPAIQPSISTAFVLRVEYDEAIKPHSIRLDLVRDGAPVGQTIGGTFGPIGHAPGLKAGAASMVPMAFTVGLLTLDSVGLYEWMFHVDDELLASVPMEVDVIPGSAGLAQMPPQS